MKSIPSHLWRALGACALIATIAAGISAFARTPLQAQGQQAAPQMSEAENQAVTAINTAVDAAAKLAAAEEFIKKYPKSSGRMMVARHVGAEIAQVQDLAQRIGLLEKFQTVFTGAGEAETVTIALLDAYLKADRIDDAFSAAATHISKNPGDVTTLTQMALIGVEQAKSQNTKFLEQSQDYGMKAIGLIETDTRPETIELLQWSEYKTRWLPQLYQSMGLLSYIGGNRADAKSKLEKAASLNQTDPFNYLLLGSLVNDEYQQMAMQHKGMADGPDKDELLKKAHAKMDEVVELYAQVIALSEGKLEYQQLHDQLMQDFQAYYQYRHNNSTDGMRELIDKYKKP